MSKKFNGVIIVESLENQDVTKYGVSLGIPDYQLDFSPHIKEWEK